MDETLPEGLVENDDGLVRCAWGSGDHADYRAYHDAEWGMPVTDDSRLFEKLCLEGFQSGLSWLTILRKRDAFRRAFSNFDIGRVARYGARDIDRLLDDAAIVRHRGKIESTISNARRALALVAEEGSLARYVWGFEPDPASRPTRVTHEWLVAHPQTEASRLLARDLKRRGWSFVGPTTVYAFMQAMGLVNDHLEGCHARSGVETARASIMRS